MKTAKTLFHIAWVLTVLISGFAGWKGNDTGFVVFFLSTAPFSYIWFAYIDYRLTEPVGQDAFRVIDFALPAVSAYLFWFVALPRSIRFAGAHFGGGSWGFFGGLVASGLAAAAIFLAPSSSGPGFAALIFVIAIGFPWNVMLLFALGALGGPGSDVQKVFGPDWMGFGAAIGLGALAGAFINGFIAGVVFNLLRAGRKPKGTSAATGPQ